jgi:quinol monooxygenase YgiN
MLVHVILELQSKPDKLEEVKGMLKNILPDTRVYAGCHSVVFTQNRDDVNNMIIIEKWESREIYEAYLNWRIETGVFDSVADLLDKPPSIRFYDDLGI